MFVLLIFFQPSFASNEIILQSSYCIKEPYIYVSDLDAKSEDVGIIFSIPQSSSLFKIPSIKLISRLEERGYRVSDESGGVILVKRNCHNQEDLRALHVKVEEAFEKAYPNINIISLVINPSSTLPPNFEGYVLENIVLSASRLKKSSGTFLANFSTREGGTKSLYFRFEIDGEVSVYRTKRDLMQGKTLDSQDYEQIRLKLEDMPVNTLLDVDLDTWVAKFYIKKGSILTKNRLIQKPTIRKGDMVSAILQDNTLSMKIEARALSSGNMGETIRVRVKNGKVFSGMIVDKKRVIIR